MYVYSIDLSILSVVPQCFLVIRVTVLRTNTILKTIIKTLEEVELIVNTSDVIQSLGEGSSLLNLKLLILMLQSQITDLFFMYPLNVLFNENIL